MITWPDWLPAVTTNFTQEIKSSAIRTNMEGGRTRQRPRFVTKVRTCSASWELTDDEFAIFQSIYQHSLNNGSDWFNMNLPFGEGMKSYVVRFVADSYSASHFGFLNHNVSAKLETRDQDNALTAEEIEAILLVDGIDAFHLAVEYLEEVVSQIPA